MRAPSARPRPLSVPGPAERGGTGEKMVLLCVPLSPPSGPGEMRSWEGGWGHTQRLALGLGPGSLTSQAEGTRQGLNG